MLEFNSPHTLMVQGTTSDAGKSLLVTAICRLLQRRGYAVAPFKPQNMSLNSAVSVEEGEIGRAQAVQAEASLIPATTDMNPILLKPNSDVGAQVIVFGKAIGNYQAQEYHQLKPQLMERVVEAYERLQESYTPIIVEGAGSPAEINLREHDIANMGFAERVDCPVIIVADIDRGGVFAHLLGTFELLSDSEKRRVKGFVVNKFRGDISLLRPGLEWLKERTGVPILGVIPYIPNLHIEAEDSLQTESISEESKSDESEPDQSTPENCSERRQVIHVVVPLYPRTSNHTDFDPLRLHPDVKLTFLRSATAFRGADLIILPGSKHVRGDLQWLMGQGWGLLIERHLRYGGKVIGICGGYQMMGRWIHDPKGVESKSGSARGLNLFDMETTLTGSKTLRNVHGRLLEDPQQGQVAKSGLIEVEGYEIHAGVSRGPALSRPLFSLISTDAKLVVEGARSEDDNVMGSYLHGMFDKAEMLEYLLNWVLPDRAIPTVRLDYAEFRQQQIDKLADHVEQAISIDRLAALLSLDRVVGEEGRRIEQGAIHGRAQDGGQGAEGKEEQERERKSSIEVLHL